MKPGIGLGIAIWLIFFAISVYIRLFGRRKRGDGGEGDGGGWFGDDGGHGGDGGMAEAMEGVTGVIDDDCRLWPVVVDQSTLA